MRDAIARIVDPDAFLMAEQHPGTQVSNEAVAYAMELADSIIALQVSKLEGLKVKSHPPHGLGKDQERRNEIVEACIEAIKGESSG